eukprot:TRINITY_DN30481_c0_g1_i7.p1 TRINITY_DN30481_c0_g1~~TRINITY_DN30481_c0_g1_i7.p1  ORF type:complete len:234 (-),score=25.80 TRINITY_DN30481_c0_g1_i7:478-1107(-)
MNEVQLYNNKKEQEFYDSCADLYSLIKTCEKLERAYVRDAVSAKEYEEACQKLIGQFRTLWGSIRGQVPDVEQFVNQYNMQCPMAITRLVHVGMPATIEYGKPAPAQSGNAVHVAESVQFFITAMDALKLNQTAVDEVYPLLTDLLQALNKVSNIPQSFTGKEKVKKWVSKLNSMPAHHELAAEETRQLLFDLESCYNEFMAMIQSVGT